MSSITDRLRDMAGLLGEEAAELIEDNDRSYALLFAENARLKAEIAALSPQPQQAAPTCPKCGKRPESFCRAALIPCDATIKVEKWPELPEPQQAAVVPEVGEAESDPFRCVNDSLLLDWLDNNLRMRMGWEVHVAKAGNISVGTIVQLGNQQVTGIREAIQNAMGRAEVLRLSKVE